MVIKIITEGEPHGIASRILERLIFHRRYLPIADPKQPICRRPSPSPRLRVLKLVSAVPRLQVWSCHCSSVHPLDACFYSDYSLFIYGWQRFSLAITIVTFPGQTSMSLFGSNVRGLDGFDVHQRTAAPIVAMTPPPMQPSNSSELPGPDHINRPSCTRQCLLCELHPHGSHDCPNLFVVMLRSG